SRVACTRCSTSFPPSGRGLSTSSATGSPSGSSAGRSAVSSHDPFSPELRVGCAAMAPPVLPRELVYLALDDLEANETFRLREVGDVSSLAQSIAQLGQLFPVEVRLRGGKYQLITGFRRLAALRMLLRKRILARVHVNLSEQEAALIAAADAIDNRALELDELRALEALYAERGWSTPALSELISRAIEKAEERLEDIEAALRGEPPPDRSIEDEDARPLEDEG